MVGPLWPAANRRPSYRMAAPFSSRSRGGLCRSVLPFARGLAAAVAWERIDLAEFRVGGDDAPLDELLAARVLEDEAHHLAVALERGAADALLLAPTELGAHVVAAALRTR